jgi:hypothetical protein
MENGLMKSLVTDKINGRPGSFYKYTAGRDSNWIPPEYKYGSAARPAWTVSSYCHWRQCKCGK